jgi:hypothetical protein
MIMILSRNASGSLDVNDIIAAAMPEHRRGDLQRMDGCLYNRKWRAYPAQRSHWDHAAELPVTDDVYGISTEWGIYQG